MRVSGVRRWMWLRWGRGHAKAPSFSPIIGMRFFRQGPDGFFWIELPAYNGAKRHALLIAPGPGVEDPIPPRRI